MLTRVRFKEEHYVKVWARILSGVLITDRIHAMKAKTPSSKANMGKWRELHLADSVDSYACYIQILISLSHSAFACRPAQRFRRSLQNTVNLSEKFSPWGLQYWML